MCSGCTPASPSPPPPRIRKTFWAAHQAERGSSANASTAVRGLYSRADGFARASARRGTSTLPASRRRVVRAGQMAGLVPVSAGLVEGPGSRAEAAGRSPRLPASRRRVTRVGITGLVPVARVEPVAGPFPVARAEPVAGLVEGLGPRAEAVASRSPRLPASRRRVTHVRIAGLSSACRWACRPVQIRKMRPSVMRSARSTM